MFKLQDEGLERLQEELFKAINNIFVYLEGEPVLVSSSDTSNLNIVNDILPNTPLKQAGEITLLNTYSDYLQKGLTYSYELEPDTGTIVLDDYLEIDLVDFASNIAYVEIVRVEDKPYV